MKNKRSLKGRRGLGAFVRAFFLGRLFFGGLIFLESAYAVTFQEIENLYEENKSIEALSQVEQYLKTNPVDIDAIELYYKVLMDLGMYDKLQNALESTVAINRSRLGFYEAQYYYQMGDYKKARDIALKSINASNDSDNSEMEMQIILANIYAKVDFNLEKAIEIFQRLSANNTKESFLYQYALFLIENTNDNDLIQKELDIYAQKYPNSHRRFYLLAKHSLKKGDYPSALDHINRAYFAVPTRRDYNLLRLEIAMRLQNGPLIVEILESFKEVPLEPWLVKYMRAYYNVSDVVKNSSWIIENRETLEKVVTLLLDAANLGGNEICVFLLEELLLRNYPSIHPYLKRISELKREEIRNIMDLGDYKNSYYLLSRLLEIDPQGVESRELMAHYTEVMDMPQNYLQQLIILRRLSDKDKEAIDIKIEKNRRQQKGKLIWERYDIPIQKLTFPNRENVVVDANIVYGEVYTAGMPYVYPHMLERFLSMDTKYRYVVTTRTNDYLGKGYILRIQIDEEEKGLKQTLTLVNGNTMMEVANQSDFLKGRYKFYMSMRIVDDFLKKSVPVMGEVLGKKGSNVVIDLGYRDGVQKGDKVEIFDRYDNKITYGGVVLRADEYLSEVSLDLGDTTKVWLGGKVRHLPPTSQPPAPTK